MSITIRAVKDVDGCNHFSRLQTRIWGNGEEDLVPNHVLITCIKNGGALLGAFAAVTDEISLKAAVSAVKRKFPGEIGEKNALVVEESYKQIKEKMK